MVDVSLWPAAAVGCVWICRLALVDAVKAYRERTLVAQAIEAELSAIFPGEQLKQLPQLALPPSRSHTQLLQQPQSIAVRQVRRETRNAALLLPTGTAQPRPARGRL